MLVAFWGPTGGQTCTTSSMLAVATMLALDYPIKVAVTQLNVGETLLERSLLQFQFRKGQDSRGVSGGMDAVLRLADCGLLTPAALRDHTESVLKDRLDVLHGPSSDTEDKLISAFPQMKSAASGYYDLFFIDVSATLNPSVMKLVLESADLIIVTLNQNAVFLEHYFSNVDNHLFANDGKRKFCLGSFEPNSRYSLDLIKKKFKIRNTLLGTVPRNLRFMDSLNEGNLLDFLLRSMAVKKQWLVHDEGLVFISSIREIGKRIMHSLDLAPLEEVSLES